jgi:3-mercaptopyruvate sulfurtransferase SseA
MKPLLAAADLASDPACLVLDLRPRADYLRAHWPGSTHLDLQRWEALLRSPEGDLQQAAHWHHEIGAQGIDGRRQVVVLDDGRSTDAARAWFILQRHGVSVQVLEGGWPAVQALGVRTERGDNLAPAVSYAPPAAHVPALTHWDADEDDPLALLRSVTRSGSGVSNQGGPRLGAAGLPP